MVLPQVDTEHAATVATRSVLALALQQAPLDAGVEGVGVELQAVSRDQERYPH